MEHNRPGKDATLEKYAGSLLCSWTPKPMNPWRLFILRLFGAWIKGNPFVHQRARIKIPWNLTLHNRACLGDRANVYSLGISQYQRRRNNCTRSLSLHGNP